MEQGAGVGDGDGTAMQHMEAGKVGQRQGPGRTRVTVLQVREHYPLASEEFYPLWSASFTYSK